MAMKNKPSVAVGVFSTHAEAQQAIRELKRVGFTEAQIGVVAPDHDAARGDGHAEVHEEGSLMAEGAAAGAAAGAGVGAVWALGIAAGFLPAIGPIVAGGLLGSILASAAGGAAIAGLAGALIGLGIPEEEAEFYESEFKSGRTIVTVRANGRYDEAVSIMRQHHGFDMKSRSHEAASTSSGFASSSASHSSSRAASGSRGTGESIELHEEELHAEKHPVQKGNVKVSKEVVTEHKTIQVPVTREEVVIERHPVSGQACGTEFGAGKEEIRIPVKEEEVDVSKRTVTREEVKVGKRQVHETKNVAGDVRREELKVEKQGDAKVRTK